MAKVHELLVVAALALGLGLAAGPADAQNRPSYNNSSPPPSGGHSPAERPMDYRNSGPERDGGHRPQGDGREARAAYHGGRDFGRQGYYGREGYGWRNGFHNRGYPAPSYGRYPTAPVVYSPLPRYGPVGYVGWAHGGGYAPAVVVPAPAYRGWGIGYGYVAAPVVIAAPVYRGWGYVGF